MRRLAHVGFLNALGSSLMAVLVCLMPLRANALDDLSNMEDAFFQRVYVQQPIEERIARLESLIFGENKQGGLAERQAQLIKTALSNKLAIVSQPLPDELGPVVTGNGDNYGSPDPSVEPDISAEPDATDYPSVTALEVKLFNTSYAKDNILQRLSRLEQQVFQRTYAERPLASRVDQLTLRVLPDSNLAQEQQWRNQFASRLPQTGPQFNSQNLAIYAQLSAVEMQVFQKSYGGETLTNRLNRLEGNLFGGLQPGTIDERFDNIISNYNSVLRSRQLGRPSYMAGPATPAVPNNGFWQPPQPYTQPMGQLQPPAIPQFPSATAPNMGGGDLLAKLSQMEMAVFGKTFTTTDINNRITNLELKVIKSAQPLSPIASRIQALDQRLRGNQ